MRAGLILSVIFWVLFLAFVARVYSADVYDAGENRIYHVDNGRIYDKEGHYQGRVGDNGVIYDKDQHRAGKVDDGKVYDKDGHRKATVDLTGRIYDPSGKRIGTVRGR